MRYVITPFFLDPLQTMLPGSGHTPEFNHHIAASLAAAQQAHLAAGLYSAHNLASQHEAFHAHTPWGRQEPTRHGKFMTFSSF